MKWNTHLCYWSKVNQVISDLINQESIIIMDGDTFIMSVVWARVERRVSNDGLTSQPYSLVSLCILGVVFVTFSFSLFCFRSSSSFNRVLNDWLPVNTKHPTLATRWVWELIAAWTHKKKITWRSNKVVFFQYQLCMFVFSCKSIYNFLWIQKGRRKGGDELRCNCIFPHKANSR